MQYLDKSTGERITLTPSKTHFLAIAAGDAEVMQPLFQLTSLAATRSTNADGVVLLRPRSEGESVTEIQREVDALRAHPGMKAVVPALVDESGEVRFALPRRVIVLLKDGVEGKIDSLAKRVNGRVVRRYRSLHMFEIEIKGDAALEQVLAKLAEDDAVDVAEPAFYGVDDQEMLVAVSVAEAAARSDGDAEVDTAGVLQWNLARIHSDGAWVETSGRPDVLVLVVDGLPEAGHEALAGKMAAAVEEELFFGSDRAESAHATYVASTVVGESERMRGVAPGARVLPLVVNLRSQVYAERADAIRFAADLARRREYRGQSFSRVVLCASWKTAGDVAVVRVALADAVAAGVLPVFSAGNDGVEGSHFPSDYARTPGPLGAALLSVAATDRNDALAGYSNRSPAVSLCAPGGDGLPVDERDVLCAEIGNTYSLVAGTSIAAPHVAGVAALILSVNPALAPSDVKRILVETCDDISARNPGLEGKIGGGRVNARLAVERAKSSLAPVADPPAEPEPPEVNLPSGPVFSASVASPSIRVERAPDRYPIARAELTRARDRIEQTIGWRLLSARVSTGDEDLTIDVS